MPGMVRLEYFRLFDGIGGRFELKVLVRGTSKLYDSCVTKSCMRGTSRRPHTQMAEKRGARTREQGSRIGKQSLGFQNNISVAVVLNLMSVRPRRYDFGVVENLRGREASNIRQKWAQKWALYDSNATIKSPGSTKLTTS
jgi:hypothetical protein